MDMDITMERLLDDFEGVISQINDIVARKDIQAARRAMEQIAEIVAADNPDVELDTRADPNMDHVLHELLSRINGVIETKGQRTYVIDETEEGRQVEEELHIIDTEIDQIDIEINNIRRAGKRTRTVAIGDDETETAEDKTITELNRRIEELTRRRSELQAQFSNPEVTDGTAIIREIAQLNTDIAELESQRDKLIAQAKAAPNVDIDELTRQITELRRQRQEHESSRDNVQKTISSIREELDSIYIKSESYSEIARDKDFLKNNPGVWEKVGKKGDILKFNINGSLQNIEYDPYIHSLSGDFDGLGVLREIVPELQSRVIELRRSLEASEKQLEEENDSILSLVNKEKELEAQIEAARTTRTQNTHDRIIALEEEIAELEAQKNELNKSNPNANIDELNRQIAELRQQAIAISDDIKEVNHEDNPSAAQVVVNLRAQRQEIYDKITGLEAQLEAAKATRNPDPKDRINQIDQEIEAKRKELHDLLKTLVPDKSAAIAEIDEKLKALKNKARILGEDLAKLKGQDELYAKTYDLLVQTNEEIRRLEEERINLLQVSTTRTKRGPTKILKGDSKLTEEQQIRIKRLLERKQQLLLRRKEVVKQVRKHQKVIITGEGEKYDLTKVSRELGDPFFKTHEIRQALAERGVTDEDYLRFYDEGIAKFNERQVQLNGQLNALKQELKGIIVGPNQENYITLLKDEKTSKEDKLKILEAIRKNFLSNEKFKDQMIEAGFDKELTEENMDKFKEFFDKYTQNTTLVMRGIQSEMKEIAFNIRVLEHEKDSITRGQQAERDAEDGGKRIKADAEADKKLRDEQIETTMFGNPKMEEKWDETVKRFYNHRQTADRTFEITKADGTVVKINFDTIGAYEGRDADAHFLNLDDYKRFLELTTAYDNAEKEEQGLGLKLVKEHFDFFTDNPNFKAAYEKILAEQGEEAADRLLLEYINEKKEYVKTFHGLTNREAVKYATLKTAGSTLTAMRPVRGNLPVPVKMGNAVSNVFRFAGLRLPHFTKIDAEGKKVPTIKSGIGTILTDALVIGAGALAISTGPVGIATWAAAYGVRGAVTAGNVIAARGYYKKHKDVIDAGLPTLAEPPEYTKEVARRDFYRQQIMDETGKPEVGLIRQFTTWVHAKSDRLPFRKAARKATHDAIVEKQQSAMHEEIDGNATERVEATQRNAEQSRANREIRDRNRQAEARSQVTYNSVFRDSEVRNNPEENMDGMTSNVAVNAAIRSRGSTLRVDVAKGTVGTAEQVGAGRYKKPEETLEQTQGMEVVPDKASTMTANTAITEEEHYQGEKEHRDFWNRVITAVGAAAAGMAIRYGYTRFMERRMTDPGTQETTTMKHHDEEVTKEWVDGQTTTKNVETEVPDYATQYDLQGHTLEDVTRANAGRQVTGYYSVSGGQRGPEQITLSGNERITAMWQDDGTRWGTGVGDTAGLNQHTGFIDRTVSQAFMDGNGVMRQGLKVEDLAQAVGQGKVDPATLQGTYVSLGDNHWVSLQELMSGMTKQVQVGSHIEMVPTEVVEPGQWVDKIIPAWDEPITVPGTPPTYEDVFSWKAAADALTQSAIAGAGVGAIDALHEASRATYRTSVDALNRNGGTFTDRNPILARSSDVMEKLADQIIREDQKAKGQEPEVEDEEIDDEDPEK